MLLTIGMIVKNEEKYLRRCLEAISPILQNVDSELIIADTGSTDSTVEIAQDFTENVLHYDWNNDFAAARNSTLEKARGKWYMYIDADEIIEDCGNIIRFFNSGDYKKYNSALITIENFNYESQSVKAPMKAYRLAKRTKDLRFVNPIHERLNTFEAPAMDLEVVAAHYGYLIENNEERLQKKMKRNLGIMFDEEEKNPSDVANLYNICQAYSLLRNIDASLTYCDKGLKYAKEQKSFYEILFQARKVQLLFIKGDYTNLLIAVDEYFSSKDKILATDIEMYIYKAEAYEHFHASNQAIDSFKAYVKLFMEYKNGQHKTLDSFQPINYTDIEAFKRYVMKLVDLLIRVEKFDEAHSYSKLLETALFSNEPTALRRKLDQDILIMSKRKDFSELPALYHGLSRENQLILQEKIEAAYYGQYGLEILRAFNDASAGPAGQTYYAKLMRLRYRFLEGTVPASEVDDLLGGLDEADPRYDDLVYLTVCSGASLGLLSRYVEPFDFASKPYLPGPCSSRWLELLKYPEGEPPVDRCLWLAALYERALTSDAVGTAEKPGLFTAYARFYGLYLKRFINASAWTEEDAQLLPEPLKKGLLSVLAVNYRDRGQKVDYIRCLRSILKAEPKFGGLIQYLFDGLSQEENQKKSASQEFLEYARIIKNNILALCEQNETEKALGIIASYEQLCPDDEDIKALKERFNI